MSEIAKIVILGGSGCGKSTVASELSKRLELPLYFLDKLMWKPGWKETTIQERLAIQQEIITQEKSIIEGNFAKGGVLQPRIKAADIVFIIHVNPLLATYRILKRRIQYHGSSRPDVAEGCPEKLSLDFWWNHVWNFRSRKLPKMKRILEENSVIYYEITSADPLEVIIKVINDHTN